MSEIRTTIADVPSGLIELVINDNDGIAVATMQFNCSCLDAQPWCKSMCCRMQTLFSAPMTADEAARLGSRYIEHKDLVVLPTKPNKPGECTHLSGEGSGPFGCSVNETKPASCKDWHCSPGGVGVGITRRANGWIMLPSQ